MKDMIKDTVCSAAELTFGEDPGYSARRRDACTAASRFCRVSRMLDNGYLGLQVSCEGDGGPEVLSFSNDRAVTADDHAWIFRSCGKTQERPSGTLCGLFGGKRKIYVLRPADRKDCEDRGYDDPGPEDGGFREVLDMMKSGGAVMRITAGTDGDGKWRCLVLLGLSGAMTLRMRAALADALPSAAVEEITAETGAPWSSQSGLVRETVSGLLYEIMIRAERENSEGYDGEGPFIDIGPGEFTPIEDLDLSIRSFNCLKRAGIHSVEQLRAMSEDDLRHVRNLGRKSVEEIHRKLDKIRPRPETPEPPAESGMDALDSMVGLSEIKEQVRRIAAFARMKSMMAESGADRVPAVLNMEFTGNPGTAKTTAARALARILHETGILPCGEVLEVGRADLVAEYVGQTAVKVKDVFEKARGRLLFIDEAYSLADGRGGGYGDEALSAIVQEMENSRDETVVVFAGYPDKMEKLFSRNPGLRSRVPFTLRFPDYTAEEMVRITEAEARKRGFAVSDEGRDLVLSICETAQGRPETGNGRFCRNLAESAILNYAGRVCGDGAALPEGEPVLTEADFALPVSAGKERRTVPIGFRA